MGFSSNGSCSSNLFYILVKHSIYLSQYKYTEYWIERSTTKAIVLVVDKIDYMQSIVETFGPTATILGGGFFVGVLIGYALKKVIKIVAVVVGLFLAGLAYLQSLQIASINWNKLQTISEGAITTISNAITQIPDISVDSHAATASLALSSFGIPFTGSMSTGFTIGFMKG